MAIEKGVGGPLIGHKMHETAALKNIDQNDDGNRLWGLKNFCCQWLQIIYGLLLYTTLNLDFETGWILLLSLFSSHVCNHRGFVNGCYSLPFRCISMLV